MVLNLVSFSISLQKQKKKGKKEKEIVVMRTCLTSLYIKMNFYVKKDIIYARYTINSTRKEEYFNFIIFLLLRVSQHTL